MLRVQLYGRHLLERNVAGPAVPAATQAAPRRRGHGAATQPRRSARARLFLGRGSFATRAATPRRGGEAVVEARPPGQEVRTARLGGAGRGREVGGASCRPAEGGRGGRARRCRELNGAAGLTDGGGRGQWPDVWERAGPVA